MKPGANSVVVVAAIIGALVTAIGGGSARAAEPPAPCGFDIFILGDHEHARDLTNTPNACEFNPDWSPDRRAVVADHLSTDAQGSHHDLYVTDVETGTSTPLLGGSGGNDGNWAPDGRTIAFDGLAFGDATVYVVPSGGGFRRAVVSDAGDPDWSPNGRRLAFARPSDGSIRTLDLEGGDETIVVPPGANAGCGGQCGLAWAPNGRWIAYSTGLQLWVVAVTRRGAPLAPPTQVLNAAPFYASFPTFTTDSESLVFSSGDVVNPSEAGLWTIPVEGGTPRRIEGPPSAFNYDPSVARNGDIAYSGSTGDLAPTETWDAAADFRKAPDQANPSPDSHGNAEVWSYLFSDSPVHDPSHYHALPEFTVLQPDWQVWRSGDPSNVTPLVGVINDPSEIIMHPGHPNLGENAVLGWRSPFRGRVIVTAQARTHPLNACSLGTGVIWSIDKGSNNLTSGFLAPGGFANVQIVTSVKRGEVLYFVDEGGADTNCDTTFVHFTVTRQPKERGDSEDSELDREHGRS